MADWRDTDRYNLALLFDLPIDQDRDDSHLDHEMKQIKTNDTRYSTDYVTIAKGLIDESLTLREAIATSYSDIGIKRIDIDRQIAVTQESSAEYQQASARYRAKLSELRRIFGYPPPGRNTIRS